jgi:hypothetical protein
MTTTGWLMLIVSNIFVLALCVFCFAKVLSMSPATTEDTLQGPNTIDTKDTQNAD